MHHNITLLRIHSQQSQVVSVILVVYLEAVWCRERKTGCRVKKIIKCNSRMKKKKNITDNMHDQQKIKV